MTPIPELRQIAQAMLKPHAGAVDDKFFETFNHVLILELLDELEELRGAKPAKRNDYPPEFDEAWAAYPERSNANKIKAFKAWTARVKAGTPPAVILAGVKRYACYVLVERTEDRFILQPATFFGPDENYALPWTLTKAVVRKGQIHGSIGKQDFSAGVRSDGSF